jgi:hypothetical protein
LPTCLPGLLHLQLAAVESEQGGKSKQARGALGALERSTLAKGKVQAASVRKLHGSFSGEGRRATLMLHRSKPLRMGSC